MPGQLNQSIVFIKQTMVLLVSKSSSSSSRSSFSGSSNSKSYESDYVPLSERFNEIAPSSKKAIISPWREEKARAFLHFESNFMDMDDDKMMALLYSSSAPKKRRRLTEELIKRIDAFVGFFRGHLLQTMTRHLC